MQSYLYLSRVNRFLLALSIVTCATYLSGLRSTSAVDLLQEDFDDVPLQPTVGFFSELRNREAWTDAMPTPFNGETWSVDNSLMPPGTEGDNDVGVLEFEGWRIVDRNWWVQTASGQDRQEFLSANGSIFVADPDEWDDFPNEAGTQGPTEYGHFDSTLRISGISLQGIAQNTARLSFFSSWRPEAFDDGDNTNNQSATLKVVYDDPANTTVDVLTWDSDETSPNYKPDATNEFVNVPLENPAGATSATLEFRLFKAANDWWWAIDNLNMFTGDVPDQDGALRLIIDRDTQQVTIKNNTAGTVNLRGYSIESNNGTLDESAANYMADTDSSWVILDNPVSSELSEGNLDFEPLASQAEINLGTAWRKFYADYSDIRFQYSVEGEDGPKIGIVEFQGNLNDMGEPTSFDSLDLNFDGEVDFADYQEFLNDYGSVPNSLLATKLLAERHSLGDLDHDKKYSVQDFLEFKRQFDIKFGAGAFQALVAAHAVPEPAALALVALAGCLCLGVRYKHFAKGAVVLAAAVALVGFDAQHANAQLTLFEEDFEGVVLQDSPDDNPDAMNVWSKTFAGWTIDDSNMPYVATTEDEDGVVDWAGWVFVDKNYWVDEAGNQTRDQFTRGKGTVIVADPDEWDDDGPPGTTPVKYYDSIIRSPVINIPGGIPAGKIRVSFDSSWRPEGPGDNEDDTGGTNNQTAMFDALYNGSTRVKILKYQSDPQEDDYKPDAQNEGVDKDLQYNGSSTTLQLEFRLSNAWNDWWWALDNVRVFVPADPSILRIDLGTGNATLIGGDVINVDLNSIDIQSENGNLNPAANAGLSFTKPDSIDGDDPDSIVGSNLGESWQLAAANENFFSEFFLEGSSSFTDGRTEQLGRIFDISTPVEDRDVIFTYTNIFGAEIEGMVEYVGTPADADFDGDGDVDGIDFLVWQRNAGTTGGPSFGPGDANGDGNVDQTDLSAWQAQFGTSSFAATAAKVPEPNAIVLLLLGSVPLGILRGRNSRRSGCRTASMISVPRHSSGFSRVIACVGLALIATSAAQAVAPPPSLDRDYNFGEDDGITVGSQVSDKTIDNAGTVGAGQQVINLLSFNVGGAKATYEEVVGRPDGVGGTGILLNGVSVFGNPYARKHYLKTYADSTQGAQLALNLPIRSPSSTESDFGTGSIDYRFITDRGFQLWVQPANLPAASQNADIVMDSNNHGVFIQNDGTFAMRYAGQDYTGVTQVTQQAIDSDTWYHLMVVRPSGPNSGSILYVNGVAEAAAIGTYLGEQDLTAEEVLPPDRIDDSPLVVGTNTDEDAGQVGQRDFFSGMVDDLEMFVMGFNESADYGEFVFERDNKFANFFKLAQDGDVTGDGLVTMDDVTIFADNWLYEKRLTWTQGTVERSLRVGDLSTRALGDFDYSGRIDLRDWEILNDQNPTLAAAAMAMIQSVPEPSSLLLAAGALTSWFLRRRPPS